MHRAQRTGSSDPRHAERRKSGERKRPVRSGIENVGRCSLANPSSDDEISGETHLDIECRHRH
jgi:hypothetical protein